MLILWLTSSMGGVQKLNVSWVMCLFFFEGGWDRACMDPWCGRPGARLSSASQLSLHPCFPFSSFCGASNWQPVSWVGNLKNGSCSLILRFLFPLLREEVKEQHIFLPNTWPARTENYWGSIGGCFKAYSFCRIIKSNLDSKEVSHLNFHIFFFLHTLKVQVPTIFWWSKDWNTFNIYSD